MQLQIVNEDEEQENILRGEKNTFNPDANAASITSKPTVSLFGPKTIDGASILNSEAANKKKSAHMSDRQLSAQFNKYQKNIVLNPYQTIFNLRQR